jgi:hypothetical protein
MHACEVHVPLKLHNRGDGRAQSLGGLQGEVDVSQDLSSKVDDVCFAVFDNVIGLSRVGDDAHGADDDVLDVLFDVLGEWDLW